MKIDELMELLEKKCIFCDKKLAVVTAIYNFPNGKKAHYNCYLDNTEGTNNER